MTQIDFTNCTEPFQPINDRPKTKKPKIYCVWSSMKDRCCNPNHPAWPRYGGRGITICAEWEHDFAAFARDMGERPLGMTLERKNNNLGYSKDNCCWATRKSQALNRVNSVVITYQGIKSTLVEHCERLNANYALVRKRLLYGWSVEDAFETKSARPLTKESVVAMRQDFNSGEKSFTKLAAKYGVSRSMVSLVIKRKAWADIS